MSLPPLRATTSENEPSGTVFRALEHQMFDHVGDARPAGRFVGGRPTYVPDRVMDQRRAMVGDNDHLHPVAEDEATRTEGLSGLR